MAKKEKVSFLFYYDYLEQFQELTADEIIEMIQAAINYDRDGIEPNFEDRTLRSVWNFIKRRIDIDKVSYQKTCEKNKKIAEERWKRKILSTESTTGTNGKKNVPHDTKNTDIDKDTHIDKDSFNCVYNNKEENLKEEILNKKNFHCHLNRDSKIEACQNCLKNKQCPLKTDLQFQFEKGCSFEEWLAKKQALVEEILKKHDPPEEILKEMKDFEDYNWYEED